MKKYFFPVFVLCALADVYYSQETFPVNGAPHPVHTAFALTHANVHVNAEITINDAVMIVKDGKIVSVIQSGSIPADATIINLNGKHVYPGFIDLCSSYGIPPINYERSGKVPNLESTQKGAYAWNMAIRAEIKANELFRHDAELAETYRKCGFTTVLTSAKDGIVRGSAALVNLNSTQREHLSMLEEKAAAVYSFEKGSSPMDYPQSLTGAIALLRQSLYDANWYNSQKPATEYNITLSELSALQKLKPVFETNDKYNVLRVAALAKEFSMPFLVKTGGDEYQRLDEIKASGLRLIVPVNFPAAFDVEDPYDAQWLSLSDLKHWEMAPANLAMLEKAGIPFVITSSDLKDKSTFLKQIQKAVKYGLSEKAALNALTKVPAEQMGLSNKIGALQAGMLANFFVTTAPLFDDDSQLIETWAMGERYRFSDVSAPDLLGNWVLDVAGKTFKLTFSGDPIKPKAFIMVDTVKKSLNFKWQDNQFSFSFSPDSLSSYRGSGLYNASQKKIAGNVQLQNGNWTPFELNYLSILADTVKKNSKQRKVTDVGKVTYPFGAYGITLDDGNGNFRDRFLAARKPPGGIFIKNATVWTNTKDSILNNTDVLIIDNRIAKIGRSLTPPAGSRVIDGTGRHLTPGIIDEHSHIALTHGVNEGTQASSAEVRMGDVINPEDINIYRQLSGGVVAAQLLHGSANPIGGQSAIIKLRWGMGAEDLKINGARGFIKFALGENVKQSNWGDHNVVRFPQTRMGVEQVYNDYFSRAKNYEQNLLVAAKSAGKSKTSQYRKDLELEALAEVLTGKRFITCHSYVQSEINMLMHVADTFGFKVNTFTHILEGYKVADKMKQHGVAASTFSDWWAYKNEVLDAIPYNAALLSKAGVVTAINSDDAEMARRLNQEAAKCVKYGGLSEVEALKLVTLNPAIMLHLDADMGSVAEGKSADLVLWSGNPLSVYSKADYTIIDGSVYFDRLEDEKLRIDNKLERARIISLMLAEKNKGMPVVNPINKQPRLYHCNTIEGISETETGQR